MKIVVSACLLGCACRYDGRDNAVAGLREQLNGHEVCSVCPEVEGGLPIPRPPCERQNGRICSKNGADYTMAFEQGSRRCIQKIQQLWPCGEWELAADLAILKAKSPSCGNEQIYDGTFTRTLVDGAGIFCEHLRALGVPVVNEKQDWRGIIRRIEQQRQASACGGKKEETP